MFSGKAHRPGALLAALGIALGSLSGCGGAPEEAPVPEARPAAPEGMKQTGSELFVASSRLWRPVTIPVCWENPGLFDSTQRQWVRDAVKRTWEARSGVRFSGWQTCWDSAPGVRITISDTGPQVKVLGNALNGMVGGMVLNFTFNNWSPDCRANLKYCIDVIAIHEFGHAMGFAHEHNRPDRPSSCTEPAQGESGDWVIGAWDLNSVMNYCNPRWSGGGSLSAMDVVGAQLSYGVPWESRGLFFGPWAPAVASWDVNRVDVFTRNPTNNQLYQQSWTGASWSSNSNFPGQLTSSPAAVSWGPNRIDLFAKGLGDVMLHQAWDGAAWTGWSSHGGYFTSAPAVASWGANRLDVFGRGGDNQLYHQAWTGSGWTAWTGLGGTVTSDPAAVSWGPNRIDLFAKGSDDSIIHKAWDGTRWTPWVSLGGAFSSAPAVASWGPNRLDVFGRGMDNSLWLNSWVGSYWTGWQWLGGELNSAPGVVSRGYGHLDIFYMSGVNNEMRHPAYINGWW